MIPILYESTETTFTSNGLGRLADCIKCTVTEERNGIYECEFQYPVTGEMFAEITEGRILGVIHDDKHDIQPFDIYGRSAPLNGVVTFYAHHISYRLGNVILKPMSAESCVAALNAIPSNTYNTCPFAFWTDKTTTGTWTVQVPSAVRGMLAGQTGSILDVYGKGDYEFDKWAVKLYLNRGNDNGVAIRYGINLTDIKQDVDISGVYTAVVPYWLGGEDNVLVTLPEGYVSRAGMALIPVPLDLSGEFEEQPTVEQLRAKATSKLNSSQGWLPNENIKVSFIDLSHTEEYKSVAALQRVSLCDQVSVYYGALDVDIKTKVVRVVYNVLTEMYDEIELGDARTTLTETIASQFADATANMPTKTQVQSMLEAAVDNATNQITGALGGFVRFIYNADGEMQEIVIMDTNDINTATKVWRWNSGGLGYSSNGYAGPYGTAITQDGKIVADFITTGIMNANLIRAGIITSPVGGTYWDLDNGVFVIGSNTDISGMSAGDLVENVGSSVTGIEIEFAQNQSSATAPTSGWSTIAPSWAEGWYIWQRTKMITPDGTTYSEPTCISGRDGSGASGLNTATLYLYTRMAVQPEAPSTSMAYTFASGELTNIPPGWTRAVPAGSDPCWVTSAAAISSDTAVTLATNAWQTPVMLTYNGAAVQNVVTLFALSDSTIPPETSEFHELGADLPWTDDAGNEMTDNYGEVIYFCVEEAPVPTKIDPYVWTFQRTTYTDGTVLDSTKSISAVYGGQGIGVAEIVEQYYLSTSDQEPTGGTWSNRMPEWQSGYYLWTRSRITWTDDAVTTTEPVLAAAINAANEAAVAAAALAESASAREQQIYRSAPSGTISMDPYTTWVSSSGNVQNLWTAARPVYNSAYPVLFVATQRQTVEQRGGDACSCTDPVIDQTTTVIDGGHITTGTIDAGVVNVTNIKAGNINTGTLDAARIGAGSISAGKIASNAVTADKIAAGAITADKIATSAITIAKLGSDVTGTINTAQSTANAAQSSANTAQSTANAAQSAANAAQSAANAAQSTANGANGREQIIYRSAPADTTTMTGTTTWVSNTGDAQNAWRARRPTYNRDYPVLFTAVQRQTVAQMSGTTCSCTTPVIDQTTTVIDGGRIITGSITAGKIAAGAVTTDKLAAAVITSIDTAQSTANTAKSTANSANNQSQTIYRSALSGTSSMSGTTTWVTDVTGGQNRWTTTRPVYNSSYPVLFVATQRKNMSGTVTCTTPVIDQTTTVIDGGHITTGTIDARVVNVTNLKASEIKSGYMSADRISGGTIDGTNVNVTNLNASNIKSGTLDCSNLTVKNLNAESISGPGSTPVSGSFTCYRYVEQGGLTIEESCEIEITNGIITKWTGYT